VQEAVGRDRYRRSAGPARGEERGSVAKRSGEKLRRAPAFATLAGLTHPEFDGLVGGLACAEADLRAGRSHPGPADRLMMALPRPCVSPTCAVLGFFTRHKRNSPAALGVLDSLDDLPSDPRTTPDPETARSAAEVLVAFRGCRQPRGQGAAPREERQGEVVRVATTPGQGRPADS